MGRPKKQIVETDFYEIRAEWDYLKELVESADADVTKFLRSKTGKRASIRARDKINEVRKLCESLRKGILCQRQDNENEF